jgi:hypothetical protein
MKKTETSYHQITQTLTSHFDMEKSMTKVQSTIHVRVGKGSEEFFSPTK